MELSCGLPSGPDFAGLAVLAEELGYTRVWVLDAPPREDPFVHLALAAGRTSRIGLGVVIPVPAQRSAVVTAAAVTTIARVSGGRFRVCFGPGFTARSAPVRPSALVDYVAVLRKLLAGRLTIVDGRPVTMPGRVEVPLWLGVESRRDAIAAVRVADGIVGLSYPGLPAATVLSGATVPCPPAGFQEAVYLPAGMDLPGELRSFASLTTLRSENTILKLRE